MKNRDSSLGRRRLGSQITAEFGPAQLGPAVIFVSLIGCARILMQEVELKA